MNNQLTVISSLWAMLAIACAQLDLTHTYLHPPQALHKLRELELAASQLTSSHIDQITTIGKTLEPMNVLQKIGAKALTVSDLCFNQTLYMMESIVAGGKQRTWAIQMIDAWGKPGAGIAKLNLAWLGDFDECQSVTSYYNSSSSFSLMPEQFEAKYCSIGVGPNTGTAGIANGMPSGLVLGGCFPSGCTVEDIESVTNSLIGKYIANTTNKISVGCQEKTMEYSTGAIVTIVLYCIMGAICLAGTLYDVIFIMTSPKDDDDVVLHQGNGHAINQSHAENNTDTEILIPSHEKKEERKPSGLGEFLMCFSLYTNGYKLLSTKQAPGSLNCLNGIRFLSMTWVILGHTLVFSFSSIANFFTVSSWLQRWTFQVILNATVSVDSFFVLSALLTSYLMLKQLEKKKTTLLKFFISVPVMYLHRYLRLTPAYGFMILFYACLLLYTFSSPLKPTNTNVTDPFCTTNWWGAIFYVNNVVEKTKMCAAWGWYLSNDFQFFLVTPFVVYLMYINWIGGLVLSIAMVLASTLAATGVSAHYDFGIGVGGARVPTPTPDPAVQQSYMTDYYFAPWARYQSFGVGVIFGFILWKCRGKLPIPKLVNLGLWALSGIIMLSVLYGPYEVETQKRIATVGEAALYNGWSRTAWSLGLGYIMLACCLGRGGWVNELLSWRGFVPLSRMTYCAYLVHPVVMTLISVSHKNKVIWDDITLIYLFAAYLFLAYAVAFPFSLMFEAPFMLLDKKYLTGRLTK